MSAKILVNTGGVEGMRLTINIEPKDILSVVHAQDGRALVCMAIGNNVEVFLTVEEKADDVIEMLMEEDDEVTDDTED